MTNNSRIWPLSASSGSGDGSGSSYTLPAASATILGGIKVGSGLEITSAGVLSVDEDSLNLSGGTGDADAVQSNLDEHIADTSVHVTEEEKAAWNAKADADDIPDAYTLPTASATVLGGVKVGSGLSISSSGVLSATGSGSSGGTSSGDALPDASGLEDYTMLMVLSGAWTTTTILDAINAAEVTY